MRRIAGVDQEVPGPIFWVATVSAQGTLVADGQSFDLSNGAGCVLPAPRGRPFQKITIPAGAVVDVGESVDDPIPGPPSQGLPSGTSMPVSVSSPLAASGSLAVAQDVIASTAVSGSQAAPVAGAAIIDSAASDKSFRTWDVDVYVTDSAAEGGATPPYQVEIVILDISNADKTVLAVLNPPTAAVGDLPTKSFKGLNMAGGDYIRVRAGSGNGGAMAGTIRATILTRQVA